MTTEEAKKLFQDYQVMVSFPARGLIFVSTNRYDLVHRGKVWQTLGREEWQELVDKYWDLL